MSSGSDAEALIDGLGEIQRRGLRAATELVDALLTALDGEPARAGPRSGPSSLEPGDRSDGSDLRALLAAMLGSGARSPSDALPGDDPCTIEVDGDAARRALRLVTGGGGGGSTGELVVRNPTPTARTALLVHAGELRSTDGVVLPEALRIEPTAIDELPARSSRGVAVEVAAEAGAEPGTYVGLIFVGGLPDAWVPVVVVVTP